MVVPPEERPADPVCPTCGTTLTYLDSDVCSGAFRTQAVSMAQISVHFYDCGACGTCWKLGHRLLPDPIRQILKGIPGAQ